MLFFVVFLGVAYVVVIAVPQHKMARFEREMSGSRIIGKTPQKIMAIYGVPNYDTRRTPDPILPSNYRLVAFNGPYGEKCFITFVDGKATKVSFGTK